MDESAVLRVRAFGAMDASFSGAPWPRPQRHDTEVLWLFLLLHRDLPLRREHVAFSLWPDLPAEAAKARLRGHVHWLERHLPPRPGGSDWVERDRTTMRWHPLAPIWLDVEAFEAELRRARLLHDDGDATGAARALDEAIAVYRGDLAPDIYAEWLEPHRQRLRAALVDALHRATALAAAAGRLDAAIATVGRALAADPLSEELHRQAMALHARTGDRASALRQLQACRDVLWSELGVEPAAETLALGAEIRDGAIGPGGQLPGRIDRRSSARSSCWPTPRCCWVGSTRPRRPAKRRVTGRWRSRIRKPSRRASWCWPTSRCGEATCPVPRRTSWRRSASPIQSAGAMR